MLQVKNINFSVGKNVILQNISLDVQSGQIVGLLGPSGSGKTTLLKHIVGTLPSDGKVVMDGKNVPFKGMYSMVGYMLQADALYEDLSCEDNLIFFAKAMGVSKPKEATQRTLELCELTNARATVARDMSGGMKRRLSLAIALINEPLFLVLDEPTVGIDPVMREKFWEFFHKIKRENGTSMIVTTHVMSDAEECDNLYIMSNGVIVASGTADELKQIAQTTSMDKAYTVLSRKINQTEL